LAKGFCELLKVVGAGGLPQPAIKATSKINQSRSK